MVKRLLGGRKVGHLGTLDPFATGLLPLCVGQGTKCAPYLNVADKRYKGVVRLGVCTDTLDVTGEVVATAQPPAATDLDLAALAGPFVGKGEQVPPAFSAIKRGGTPMYELARKGEAPELEPRPVEIYSLALSVHDESGLALDLHCSKGTYVRSLARDIGGRLGCGAVLESLVRTGFGAFRLEDAPSLDALEGEEGRRRALAALITPLDSLPHLRLLEIDAAGAVALRGGQQQALGRLGLPEADEEVVRIASEGRLVAVARAAGRLWKLDRVFT